MKIRVVRCMNANCWYSEMKGQVFHAFRLNELNVIFFTYQFFFYPEDVEIVTEGIGLLPSVVEIGYA